MQSSIYPIFFKFNIKNMKELKEKNENYFEDTTNKLITQLDERNDVILSLSNNLNSSGLLKLRHLEASGIDVSGYKLNRRKTHST
jgi:flagellar hook protein FlgE